MKTTRPRPRTKRKSRRTTADPRLCHVMDQEPRGPAHAAGPLVARGPSARIALLVLAFLVAGCGAGRSDGPGPAGTPPPDGRADRPPVPAPDADVPSALDRTRSILTTEPRRALQLADSLYFAIRSRGGADQGAAALRLQARAAVAMSDTGAATARLRELLFVAPGAEAAEGAALELARLHRARAEDPAAVSVLLRRGSSTEEARAVMRRAAGAMSVEELEAAEATASGADAPASVRALVLAALAEARARAGRPVAARSAARRALEADPDEPDRRTARAVLEGSVEPPPGPVRIGVLLPDSGRYASVGRWVTQGMQVALEASGDAPAVEVVARDLSSGSPGRLLRELEEAGVAAVLGPMRAGELAGGARARDGPGLLVVSPTATDEASALPNTYALWSRSRRELDAAAALGGWVGARVRPGPVGAVYPEGEVGLRAYLRFRRALGESGGGWMVAASSYDPSATTLERPVAEVAAFRPDAVYAGASGTSSLLQMAPQLAYYGIRAAVVVGGPDWTRPGTVRRLDPVFSQFRVGAGFASGRGGDSGRDRFRANYEKKYRTSLSGNVLPMLGHDAALLLRRAVAAARPARPRAVARAFARLESVEGATGLLSPDAGSGTVHRRVDFRALRDRRLEATSAEEVRDWLRASGRLETADARGQRARALRAVRQADISLEGSGSEADQGGEERR